MMLLLTEEEYRALQFKPCDKCESLRAHFDEAGVKLLESVLAEWRSLPPDDARNLRLKAALSEFSQKLR